VRRDDERARREEQQGEQGRRLAGIGDHAARRAFEFGERTSISMSRLGLTVRE
jgi:hypothetical protein